MFGVSCSLFLLNATLQHHVKKFAEAQPGLTKILMQSVYIDNVVCGADNEEEAYEFYKGAKQLLLKGSINLRKFVTNSK